MIEYTVKVNDNGSREWWLNGQLHRTDGPARELADGSRFWYSNDQLHREDGPSREWTNGSREWYSNGRLHRTDGPACEWADGGREWYLNGKKITEEEFNAITKAKELTVNEIEQLLGYKIKVVGNDA